MFNKLLYVCYLFICDVHLLKEGKQDIDPTAENTEAQKLLIYSLMLRWYI